MSIKDGGPAYPTQDYDRGAAQAGFAVTVTDNPGMSLRDWFAGQALAGIMANPERWKDIAARYEAGQMTYDDASKSNAVKAYSIADAMLAARQEPQP